MPIENESTIAFFKFDFAPMSEYGSMAAKSVARKQTFAVVMRPRIYVKRAVTQFICTLELAIVSHF